MLDVIIRGDRVVTPWNVDSYDIGIQGEKIVAVQKPGTITGDARRVIDATGKLVIPGGIEPHAHVAWATFTTKDKAMPDEESRASVFGGTTTICDFAVQYPGIDIFQAIKERNSVWQANSYADYTYHPMLIGPPPPNIVSQVGDAIKAGFPSIKIFTTNLTPIGAERMNRKLDMGSVVVVMEQVAAHGGILMVHAEDDEIVMYNHQRLKAEGRDEWYNLHLVHSNMSEDISFRRVIRAAEWTGAAVYLVHVSAREGVQAIQEARSKGLPVYGETIHNYVSFTAEDYKKPDGMKYHTYPSLKSDDDRAALRDSLINGTMSCMATDQVYTSLAEKLKGRTVDTVTGGHNGIETRVGITYNEGVVKRGMSLQRFVDVISTNAAKIMGLYPRKGAIAPGSDADIVFIDPGFRKKLTLDDLHLGDYSIWEGWEVTGWPVFTMVRGKVVVEDRKLVGSKNHGQLLTDRKIAPELLKRPVC